MRVRRCDRPRTLAPPEAIPPRRYRPLDGDLAVADVGEAPQGAGRRAGPLTVDHGSGGVRAGGGEGGGDDPGPVVPDPVEGHADVVVPVRAVARDDHVDPAVAVGIDVHQPASRPAPADLDAVGGRPAAVDQVVRLGAAQDQGWPRDPPDPHLGGGVVGRQGPGGRGRPVRWTAGSPTPATSAPPPGRMRSSGGLPATCPGTAARRRTARASPGGLHGPCGRARLVPGHAPRQGT